MKNVGVPDTPLRSADSTSWAIRAACTCRVQVVVEAVDVEAELVGVAAAGRRRAGASWRREQQVVHRPERALRGRRLGRLGGELRLRMHVGQRQVPPHVAQVGVGQQLAHDRLGLTAVRALEVAELDDA